MKSAAAPAIPSTSRLRALTRREKVFVAVGALASLLFAVWLAIGRADPAPAAPPEPGPAALSESAIRPEPIAPAAAAAPAPAAPAAELSQLRLAGIMGSGAIIAFPDGVQRAVPLGREFLPGVTLEKLEVSHVVLGAAGGDFRLDLNRFGATAASAPVAVAAAQAGGSEPAGGRSERRQTFDLLLGMEQVKVDGGIGHRIKADSDVPVLRRAGLRPGDTITRVNGSSFDQERLMELPWMLANSTGVEIEYVRDGRQAKASLASK